MASTLPKTIYRRTDPETGKRYVYRRDYDSGSVEYSREGRVTRDTRPRRGAPETEQEAQFVGVGQYFRVYPEELKEYGSPRAVIEAKRRGEVGLTPSEFAQQQDIINVSMSRGAYALSRKTGYTTEEAEEILKDIEPAEIEITQGGGVLYHSPYKEHKKVAASIEKAKRLARAGIIDYYGGPAPDKPEIPPETIDMQKITSEAIARGQEVGLRSMEIQAPEEKGIIFDFKPRDPEEKIIIPPTGYPPEGEIQKGGFGLFTSYPGYPAQAGEVVKDKGFSIIPLLTGPYISYDIAGKRTQPGEGTPRNVELRYFLGGEKALKEEWFRFSYLGSKEKLYEAERIRAGVHLTEGEKLIKEIGSGEREYNYLREYYINQAEGHIRDLKSQKETIKDLPYSSDEKAQNIREIDSEIKRMEGERKRLDKEAYKVTLKSPGGEKALSMLGDLSPGLAKKYEPFLRPSGTKEQAIKYVSGMEEKHKFQDYVYGIEKEDIEFMTKSPEAYAGSFINTAEIGVMTMGLGAPLMAVPGVVAAWGTAGVTGHYVTLETYEKGLPVIGGKEDPWISMGAGVLATGITGVGLTKALKPVGFGTKVMDPGTDRIIWRGVSVEYGERSLQLFGRSYNKMINPRGRFVFGTPRGITISQKGLYKRILGEPGYTPRGATESKIIRANIGYSKTDLGIMREYPELLSITKDVKSAFKEDFPTKTKYLDEPALKEILKFTRERKGSRIYGSYAQKTQMPKGTAAERLGIFEDLAGDVDIKLKVPPEKIPGETDILFGRLKKTGARVEIHGGRITTPEGHHVVELKPFEGYGIPEKRFGFLLSKKPIKRAKIEVSALSEQGLRKSTASMEFYKGEIGPAAHRLKDVGHGFKIQNTLIESMKRSRLRPIKEPMIRRAETRLDSIMRAYKEKGLYDPELSKGPIKIELKPPLPKARGYYTKTLSPAAGYGLSPSMDSMARGNYISPGLGSYPPRSSKAPSPRPGYRSPLYSRGARLPYGGRGLYPRAPSPPKGPKYPGQPGYSGFPGAPSPKLFQIPKSIYSKTPLSVSSQGFGFSPSKTPVSMSYNPLSQDPKKPPPPPPPWFPDLDYSGRRSPLLKSFYKFKFKHKVGLYGAFFKQNRKIKNVSKKKKTKKR